MPFIDSSNKYLEVLPTPLISLPHIQRGGFVYDYNSLLTAKFTFTDHIVHPQDTGQAKCAMCLQQRYRPGSDRKGTLTHATT